MLREIFADTAHWIALQLPDDELHAAALGMLDFLSSSVQIITSEFVLFEFLNHFSGRGTNSRQTAVNTWSHLHSNRFVTILPASKELLEGAVGIYSKHVDKRWSLTDCSSFAIMRERNIHDALTADHHLEQAGFRALLK